MLEKLCGPSALKNVLLTTTQWPNLAQGESCERGLQKRGNHWGKLVTKGAAIGRFYGTRESGLELIQKLMEKEPKPLLIQHQMVNKGIVLEKTDAGKKFLFPSPYGNLN